jgi:hypothetical protein
MTGDSEKDSWLGESEVRASRQGRNILGIDQRTGPGAVQRKDQRLGQGLRVQGRVRPARLVRARISLAVSREQASRRCGKRPATSRGAHGPKESEIRESRQGRNILGIEQHTVVQRGPVGRPATRTNSQSPRESEAGASSLGRNILGIEQRTLSSVVLLKDRRLGRGLSGPGRVRLGRLVLALFYQRARKRPSARQRAELGLLKPESPLIDSERGDCATHRKFGRC